MKKRLLGNTGIAVSEVGFGAWQLANPDWGTRDEQDAIKLVHGAIDLGCQFFDTAPGYGQGNSERLLGEALAGRRSQVVLCSKYGHQGPQPDFSVVSLKPTLTASLKRLRTDYADVYLLHSPSAQYYREETAQELYAALEGLKQEGLIRAYGVSVDWEEELKQVLNHTKSQAVEVMYNAFHQDVAACFDTALTKGVGLIAKIPLDSGWLSGKYQQDATFEGVRNRWTKEVIARRSSLVRALQQLVREGESLTQLALRFALASPAISTIIPGTKSLAQLKENMTATERPLDQETLAQIHQLYLTQIQTDELPW